MNNVSVAHVIWWNLVVAGALMEMVALGVCCVRTVTKNVGDQVVVPARPRELHDAQLILQLTF
jgi:hypothetical protein